MTAAEYIMNGFETIAEADYFLALSHNGSAQILSDVAADEGITISPEAFRAAIYKMTGFQFA